MFFIHTDAPSPSILICQKNREKLALQHIYAFYLQRNYRFL